MKIFFTSLLMLLLTAVVGAQEVVDYIPECQISFSVQLSAVYEDEQDVGKCTDEEMVALQEVVSTVTELDWIASMLGTSMASFELAYEQYKTGVILSSNAKPPSFESIIETMTEDDMKYDLELAGCGDDDPTCDTLDEEDALDADTRRLVETLHDRLNRGLFAPQQKQVEQVAVVEANEQTHKLIDHRRELFTRSDCPVGGACTANWCCTFCGICNRRRLRRLNDQCYVVRTMGESNNVTDEQQRMIRKFERRVSQKMTREIRRLARQGARRGTGSYVCLGLPGMVQATMDRHFFEELCPGDEGWTAPPTQPPTPPPADAVP
jgi:hypothetical protein